MNESINQSIGSNQSSIIERVSFNGQSNADVMFRRLATRSTDGTFPIGGVREGSRFRGLKHWQRQWRACELLREWASTRVQYIHNNTVLLFSTSTTVQ
jgi:hypothetical protein